MEGIENILGNLCRLCAKPDVDLRDISNEESKLIQTFIRDKLSVEINANDTLPTRICKQCEENIVLLHSFIIECGQSQIILSNLLNSVIDEPSSNKNKNVTTQAELLFNTDVEIKQELPDDIADEIYRDEESSIDNEPLASLEDNNHSERKRIKHNDNKRQEKLSENAVRVENFGELSINTKKMKKKVNFYVKLTCHVCSKEYKNFTLLNNHVKRQHGEATLVYCKCGFELTNQSSMYIHVREHKQGSFTNLQLADIIKYECHICNIKFKHWRLLIGHFEDHHHLDEKPVAKCVCGLILKSRSAVYKHIEMHNKKDQLCDECPYVCKSQETLKKHKLKHLEKYFQCDSCGNKYNSKELLKSHMRSHIPLDARRTHKCTLCNFRFVCRSSLVTHTRAVHENIRSFICDTCGYRCATSGELKQHIAVHSDEKPYSCPKCSKSFKTYSNLKTHMDTHGDTSYECYVCNRILNTRRTFRKHLLVHETKCNHVCSYCNKAFKRRQTLKVHLAIHTGDKPYSCKLCGERFAYASTLRSHRLRTHPDQAPQNNHVSQTTYFVPLGNTDTNTAVLKRDYVRNNEMLVISKHEASDTVVS